MRSIDLHGLYLFTVDLARARLDAVMGLMGYSRCLGYVVVVFVEAVYLVYVELGHCEVGKCVVYSL